MTGVKTNERPGTRAELRHVIVSAYKVREVLDLIRGLEVGRAQDVLQFCGRGSAPMISKLLASAVANAEHNDGMVPEELYVSACYADEARTLKRWRARARGRYTRVRKRTCHITVIVSRLPEDRLVRVRARQTQEAAQRRARRVAGGRRRESETADARTVDAAEIEEQGIVDQQAPAVEVIEEAEVVEETGAEPEVIEEAEVVEEASAESTPEAGPDDDAAGNSKEEQS